MGFNFARVVGPSLGGALILWIGVAGCFVIYGVSLFLSGLEWLLIRLPGTESVKKSEQNLLEVAEDYEADVMGVSLWKGRMVLDQSFPER